MIIKGDYHFQGTVINSQDTEFVSGGTWKSLTGGDSKGGIFHTEDCAINTGYTNIGSLTAENKYCFQKIEQSIHPQIFLLKR